MVDIRDLTQRNLWRWQSMKITRYGFAGIAQALIASKSRYIAVEQATKVPWFIIAVIHEREADQRWNTQLGQGDPLSKVSVHVPIGRGPFRSWEDGAFDALVNTAPYAARNDDWSVGGALTLLEEYNGLGYAAHGVPSPYLWSGTNQYLSGKYIRDGVYDPKVIDVQMGCAGLIRTMMNLDKTIQFGAPTIVASSPTIIAPPLKLVDNKKPSLWDRFKAKVAGVWYKRHGNGP
jgi:lysozyme family protein